MIMPVHVWSVQYAQADHVWLYLFMPLHDCSCLFIFLHIWSLKYPQTWSYLFMSEISNTPDLTTHDQAFLCLIQPQKFKISSSDQAWYVGSYLDCEHKQTWSCLILWTERAQNVAGKLQEYYYITSKCCGNIFLIIEYMQNLGHIIKICQKILEKLLTFFLFIYSSSKSLRNILRNVELFEL